MVSSRTPDWKLWIQRNLPLIWRLFWKQCPEGNWHSKRDKYCRWCSHNAVSEGKMYCFKTKQFIVNPDVKPRESKPRLTNRPKDIIIRRINPKSK